MVIEDNTVDLLRHLGPVGFVIVHATAAVVCGGTFGGICILFAGHPAVAVAMCMMVGGALRFLAERR